MSKELNKKYSRKTILKFLGWSLAGVSGLVIFTKSGLVSRLVKPKKKKRFAMLMDLDKCIGCHACTVACKAENGVAIGGYRTKVLEEEYGQYPETSRFFLPMMCNHCEDAPCITACPNNAIIRKDNGIVDILKDKCGGTTLCVSACPYGAIYINPDRNPTEEVANYPSRQVIKADKCNFCDHRIEAGLEPACSDTCPTDARVFGDLEDEKSLVAKIVKEEQLSGLLESEGTKPQVYYKGGMKEIFDARKAINADRT